MRGRPPVPLGCARWMAGTSGLAVFPAIGTSFDRVSAVPAALTGKVVVWGRRPWYLSRLQSALRTV